MAEGQGRLRLDKWLWYARFFKSRGLAAKQIGGGHVRVNGVRAQKPSQPVAPGDTLTFAQASRIKVVRVVALGERRGPAPEAQALYDDLSPPLVRDEPAGRVGQRPTKRDRRALDAWRLDTGQGGEPG